jgi:hypothetical protein
VKVPVPGPHFVYHAAPDLFLGRRGAGPLEIAWDTNILLDYLEHGSALWEGQDPEVRDEEYFAELEALGIIINLWMRRDIRFRILPRSIDDAKRGLSAARRSSRARAVDEVSAALALDVWGDLRSVAASPPLDLLPHKSQEARLVESLPKGADADLVRRAWRLGVHVFLTRDAGILRRAADVRPLGLLIASPLDLLEQLTACGALLAILRPETVYWPLPDLQRAAHLIRALGG